MTISFRSVLTAGVVAFSTSAVVFTSAATPIPDTSVARAGSAVTSPLTVDLRAGTQRSIQARELSAISLLASAQLLNTAPTPGTAVISPTIAPSPPLINIANAIDAAYLAIEPWVRYGFEIATYVVGWLPFGWLFNEQIMVFYNYFESLIHSGVFNTTDWLRGQGSAVKNIADWFVDLGLALVWLGIDEVNAWIPLPPLPWYPPRPPAADLPEGVLGDLVVGASNALARVSNGIWNIWEPIESGIDGLVSWGSDILDGLAWIPFVPLINFELVAGWDLIATGVDAVVGFAHDMINAGDQFVIDTFHGDGLVAALINATRATLVSIGVRGGQAIQAWVDWGRAQIDFFVDLFTPGAASASIEQVTMATEVDEGVPAMKRVLAVGEVDPASDHDPADGDPEETLALDETTPATIDAVTDTTEDTTTDTIDPVTDTTEDTTTDTIDPVTDTTEDTTEDTTTNTIKPVTDTTEDTTEDTTTNTIKPVTDTTEKKTKSDTDTTEQKTKSDNQAPAADKPGAEDPGKDTKGLTKGLRKGLHKPAVDADNGDAGKTANKRDADADESADKQTDSDTKKPNKQADADTKKPDKQADADTKKPDKQAAAKADDE
jgi:hypothetical protein